MNSMVGGTDVIFEAARQGFDISLILDSVIDVWPDGVFQGANEEDSRLVSSVLAERLTGLEHEFFVYKNQASFESWAKDGWTDEHSNEMVHFIALPDVNRPELLQLTVVIGSATDETLRLIIGVLDALNRMASHGPGSLARSRRVDWEAELRAVGYTSGKSEFYERIEELSNALFPDWTADELACHPHEALQFCEVARRVVAPVPDYLVMKALLSRRKRSTKGAASFGASVVIGT